MEEFPVKTMDYDVPLGRYAERKRPWLYGPSYARCPLRIVDFFGAYCEVPMRPKIEPWVYGTHFFCPARTTTHFVTMDASLALGADMTITQTTRAGASIVADGRSEALTKR